MRLARTLTRRKPEPGSWIRVPSSDSVISFVDFFHLCPMTVFVCLSWSVSFVCDIRSAVLLRTCQPHSCLIRMLFPFFPPSLERYPIPSEHKKVQDMQVAHPDCMARTSPLETLPHASSCGTIRRAKTSETLPRWGHAALSKGVCMYYVEDLVGMAQRAGRTLCTSRWDGSAWEYVCFVS